MEGPGAFEVAKALAWVVGGLLVLRALLRLSTSQRFFSPVARQLRHIESCALGPKQRLHLVELDGEQLLLAATEERLTLLRRRPAPAVEVAEVEAGDDPPKSQVPETRRPRLSAGWMRGFLRFGLAGLVFAWAPEALAQEGLLAGLPDLIDGATEPERISSTLELLLVTTLFSIAPSILLMATCFTRVVIVLSLLRQALGVSQLPPNQVIVGLALAITVFAMAPVGAKIESEALQPYIDREIDAPTAIERSTDTLREFLLRHTRERDLALFVSLAEEAPADRQSISLFTLLPSFMLSEIRTAFEIGFTIFLPFLVVDLVIASMLISMQMIVLPPIVISLPFKLMLFVLLDGWNLVAGSLIDGIR